jgi:hypothetical protein
MNNSVNSENGILWVGDKALETYLNTDKNVLKAYTNYLLLFDSSYSKTDREVTYLSDFEESGKLDYDSNQLSEPIQKYFSTIENKKIDIMIGSSYELLFQKIIDMAKEVKSRETVKNDKEEYQLFSFQHFRNRTETEFDFSAKDTLFLEQNIPFKDMISDSKNTIKKAKKSYRNVLTTKKDIAEINEFLYRFSEMTGDVSNCKDVEII